MSETTKRARDPSVVRGAVLVLALGSAATLLMAWPVVRAPGQRLFGSGEILGREDPNRDALIVIEQFRTGQVAPPYVQPLTDLPGRFLARVKGPVVAYNVVVLTSFPLAAFAAYLLARYVLGSHLAAMVAGLAYAFLPFHVSHAAGHVHVAQTQWLPLYLLALWGCLDRPAFRRAVLLIVAGAAVVLSSFYGGFIAVVLSPVAIAVYGLVSPRAPEAPRRRGVAIASLALLALAVAGSLLLNSLSPAVVHRPADFAFPRSDLFLYSARWWSYLVPAVDHPLAGRWARDLSTERGVGTGLEEQQLSAGLSLLLLAVVPLWLWLRGDRCSVAMRSAPVLLALAGAALVCSLSPERSIGPFRFVRPAALLYEVAPMFRAYARFGMVVGLMIALLAGAGAAWLWQSSTSAVRAVAALLLGMAFLELMPFPWRSRDVLPTHAHRWLTTQTGARRVLDCSTRASSALILPLLGYEASRVGAPMLDDCAEPHLGDKLEALGYTHVVVQRDSTIGRWLAQRPVPEGLARGPAFEDSSILEVKADAPAVYVSALLGFYPRELANEGSDAGTTWRWMGQVGTLRLITTRPSHETWVELELKAFPGDRHVEWSLDGHTSGTLEVTTMWHPYALSLGSLAVGEAALTLACGGPIVAPRDALPRGDPRSLGLALGHWTVRRDDVRLSRAARP